MLGKNKTNEHLRPYEAALCNGTWRMIEIFFEKVSRHLLIRLCLYRRRQHHFQARSCKYSIDCNPLEIYFEMKFIDEKEQLSTMDTYQRDVMELTRENERQLGFLGETFTHFSSVTCMTIDAGRCQ